MVFWSIAALFILAVLATILLAILGPVRGSRDRAASRLAVYRHQLEEIDQDRLAGKLDPEEAEQSRLEISRRMIRLARMRDRDGESGHAPRPATIFAVTAIILVLGPGSVATYLAVGSPGHRDMPRDSRIEASLAIRENRPTQGKYMAQHSPEAEAAVLEEFRTAIATEENIGALLHEADNWSGRQGWNRTAIIRSRIIDLLGSNADTRDYLLLAESYLLAAGGYVSPEAEAAARRALGLDPANIRARYLLGLLDAQTGRPDLAVETWTGILQETSQDPEMTALILRDLPTVARLAGINIERLRDSPPEPTIAVEE